MSLDRSGFGTKLNSTTIAIAVPKSAPLLMLANSLDWIALEQLVLADLKNGLKCWWTGRRLAVRIHLGAYLLKALYHLTDRGLEERLRFDCLFQVFCGRGVVDKWHVPDYTKIEDFRNRLSPDTHLALANAIATQAVGQGVADASWMDIDSTVQEANIAYPSDASLLVKLAAKCKKTVDYVREKLAAQGSWDVDMRKIKKAAQRYFFLGKNVIKPKRRKEFKKLYDTVKEEVSHAIEMCASFSDATRSKLPWNIKLAVDQIKAYAKKYLGDVASFIVSHKKVPSKILSFHAHDVACISKQKAGRDYEFGRLIQLGRIGGDFMITMKHQNVREEDKHAVQPMVKQHQMLFGEKVLTSLGTDKGYYSRANIDFLHQEGVSEIGIQAPANARNLSHLPGKQTRQSLYNRRAGIEPLIGHTKGGHGLRKSTMKSDKATLGAAYQSVLGFNMKQLMRKAS